MDSWCRQQKTKYSLSIAVLFLLCCVSIQSAHAQAKSTPLSSIPFNKALYQKGTTAHFHYYRQDRETNKMKLIGDAGMQHQLKNGQLVLNHWVNLDMDYHVQRFESKAICKLNASAPIISILKEQVYRDQHDGLELTVKDGEANYVSIRSKDEVLFTQPGVMLWEKGAILDFHLFQMARMMPFDLKKTVDIGKILRMQASPDIEVVEDVTLQYRGVKDIVLPSRQRAKWHEFLVEGDAATTINYGFLIYLDDQRQVQRIEVLHLNSRFDRIRPTIKSDPPT